MVIIKEHVKYHEEDEIQLEEFQNTAVVTITTEAGTYNGDALFSSKTPSLKKYISTAKNWGHFRLRW